MASKDSTTKEVTKSVFTARELEILCGALKSTKTEFAVRHLISAVGCSTSYC